MWSIRPQNMPAKNSVAASSTVKVVMSNNGANSGASSNTSLASKSNSIRNNVLAEVLISNDYDNGLLRNAAVDAIRKHNSHDIPLEVNKHSGIAQPSELWSSETVSSIQTGNGHLFGSDYWRNSDVNGTLLNAKPEISYSRAYLLSATSRSSQSMPQTQFKVEDTAQHSQLRSNKHKRIIATPAFDLVPKSTIETPEASYGGWSTTEAPVTHRIRKLHMKKIMESIRNNAEREFDGVQVMKNHHRSLVAAEQLQGRPMDIELKQRRVDSDANIDSTASKELGASIQHDSAAKSTAVDGDEESESDEANFNNGSDTEEMASNRVEEETKRVVENEAEEGLGSESGSDSSEDIRDSNAVDNDNISRNDNSHQELAHGDSSSSELSEILQLADELDEAGDSSLQDVYLNDDLETTPATLTSTSLESAESYGYETTEDTTTNMYATVDVVGSSATTEIFNEDLFIETTIPTPTKKVSTKLQLVPKPMTAATTTKSTTKLTLLRAVTVPKEHTPTKKYTWKNQTISLAQKNQINVLERPKWGADCILSQREEVTKNGMHSNEFMSSQGIIDTNEFDNSNVTAVYEDNKTSIATLGPPSFSRYGMLNENGNEDFSLRAFNYSHEPSQLASTSTGGRGLSRQQSYDIGEINFENIELENPDDITMDDGHMDNRNAHGFPVSSDMSADVSGAEDGNETTDEGEDGSSKFLAGVVDAANEDEIYDWDEISRNNRRNLMRGRDVVTKFLQIVETQHLLGANCEAGTSLNLGEGVVDRYAQDRFRVEAEVAVNRANMLTRIFKMTTPAAQADVNLLHASVLSMVEFDDDIFAAGNCFDWNEHPAQSGLFCPFAYRLPAPNLGAILAKDLSMEYHYLGNTSEWFFQARKNAEKVIARNEQYLKSFHLYSNKTDERIEYDTLTVKYEDGRWSKPYYDCGGGNIWMLTYTVPFFGYENGTYHFKGTSGIDIDLRRVDIDQCPQRIALGSTQPLNIFAGTDKCKQRTTMCEALKGLGFRRGSYKCVCRKGYFFPDTISTQKFFNGSLLEEEYEKLMLGRNSTYNIINEYECLPCAEGCDYCEDGSPCIAALNWPMRTSILILACTVIGLLPPAAWFTFRYQQVKVVRAASPALLRVIALGAFFIYCTNIVMYPNPNLYTCTARIWLREIGFSLTYGALMLKTWRISVIFRVRSAKAVKITDAALLKRLGIICGVIGTCLLVRTLVSPPDVVVGRTADDLKAFLCKTDYWDYTFTSMEVLFLAWGVRLCIMVRKAPSEFNESRFISMAIYNEFLMTCFLNVSMLFLQSPANPDLLYIIFFCHTQLTVTLLLCLIFGSKVYIVLRSGKSHHETIGMGAKSSGAKFNFRPKVRTFANPSSVTTSTLPVAGTTSGDTKLSDQEALEEIRQLSVQLQRIQEMSPPKGVAVMTISSLLDGLKTPSGMLMVATAASQAAATNNQLAMQPYTSTTSSALGAGGGANTNASGTGALPLLSLSNEMEKYNQQMQTKYNNNVSTTKPLNVTSENAAKYELSKPFVLDMDTSTTTIEESTTRVPREDRAINTDLTRSEDFHQQALGCAQGHIICTRCLVISKEHYFSCRPFTPPHGIVGSRGDMGGFLSAACRELGSPPPEGSISFANIKLQCMCSQPDLDLDYETEVPQPQQQQRRRINVRSAATNTPPSTGSSIRRRNSHTKMLNVSANRKKGDGADTESSVGEISYRICDNCKNKFSSNKCGGRKFRKSMKPSIITSTSHHTASAVAATAIKAGDERQKKLSAAARTSISTNQTRSSELLDHQLGRTHSSGIVGERKSITSMEQKQKVLSTDDIIFYTTSDDSSTNSDDTSDDDDDADGACSRELVCKSTSALSAVSSSGVTTLEKSTVTKSQAFVVMSSTTDVERDTGATANDVVANTQSLSNVSNSSNASAKSGDAASSNAGDSNNKANDLGRTKRPDKLVLDLNDRSKYTKEVSV
ncbi:uncharacterized protein [Eurosta solidaginis]|uniref:uncharacterized protein n=1 Tax=Eurosta solidaginis TaxID=178769 RepID=UPI0035307020